MVFGGETADSYYDEGVTASMRGDVALAVQHFEKALKLDPYHVASYHQLGKCKVRLGELQQAVECFYRVIKARPNPIPPRLDLGFALIEGGNVDRAAEVFNEVVAVKPENGKALLGLGRCAFARGEWGAAYNFAQQAILLGGATFSALALKARAAKLSGNVHEANEAFEEAEGLLSKSIESNPEQPEAYYLRGELLFSRENFVAAMEALQGAENRMQAGVHYYSYGVHFELADVLLKRGMCLLRLDRKEEARKIALEIQKIRPNSRIAALLTDDGESSEAP